MHKPYEASAWKYLMMIAMTVDLQRLYYYQVIYTHTHTHTRASARACSQERKGALLSVGLRSQSIDVRFTACAISYVLLRFIIFHRIQRYCARIVTSQHWPGWFHERKNQLMLEWDIRIS